MKWCRLGFEGHTQIAGFRGFSIFVSTKNRQNPVFIMQHRTLDPGVGMPNTEHALTIVSDIQISFCPWCGADLRKFYRKHYQKLDRRQLEASSQ
jgi:hypothetical protein